MVFFCSWYLLAHKTLFLAEIMMMPSQLRLTYYYGGKGDTMIHLSITKLECSNREIHAIGSRSDGPCCFHALNFYKENIVC
jgi:hypothetical protein